MSERVTKEILNARAANVNRRLRGTGRHVQAEGRNGYVALDEYAGTSAIRTITVGTKREIADFLHAMMVGIDLANTPKIPWADLTEEGWIDRGEA